MNIKSKKNSKKFQKIVTKLHKIFLKNQSKMSKSTPEDLKKLKKNIKMKIVKRIYASSIFFKFF